MNDPGLNQPVTVSAGFPFEADDVAEHAHRRVNRPHRQRQITDMPTHLEDGAPELPRPRDQDERDRREEDIPQPDGGVKLRHRRLLGRATEGTR